MALESNRQPTGTVEKITCGDLVIHPTKKWPWIGTVQPKAGEFARLCKSCGGLKVLSAIAKDADTYYKIRLENEEGPIPLCQSHEASPALQDSGIGTNGTRCFGDCIDDDDRMSDDGFCCPPLAHAMPGALSFIPPLPDDPIPPTLLAMSVEGASPGRHFQVHWYPNGDLTDMDGNEKVVVPFKRRSMFHEGNQVSREATVREQGLVKQVHRRADAFVLPDYGWVITDVAGSKLKPLMDVEQCPGCFVIYKGWVGTVYNVWRRITFRMEDGTEFVVCDDQDDIGAHIQDEAAKSPLEILQMYPGLKLKIRWLLLETATWPEGYKVPEAMQEKIKRSREKWNAFETADPIFEGPFNLARSYSATVDATGEQKITKEDKGANGAQMSDQAREWEEAVASKLGQKQESVEAVAGREVRQHFRWRCGFGRFGPAPLTSAEDMTAVTVVKLEPFKIDVEWLSQVVADVPAGPKGNVIEGDELKKTYIFRSSHLFEPFELGVRYRYTVEPEDTIIPSSEYRRRLLGGHVADKLEVGFGAALSKRPRPGDTIYVAISKCSSKIDVLWEQGDFETGIDTDGLVAQYSNQPERDYFPAMYVTLQSESSKNAAKDHFRRGKSDSGMEDASVTTNASMDTGSPCASEWSVTKFGVVRKSKNSEKYATIAWYEAKRKTKENGGEMEDEPVFLREEDVSFYDLRYYHEYNYIGGTLVVRVNSSGLPPGAPNVGYVLRKNPDASVQVVWHNGEEERTLPWKLRQLTCRYSSECSASDAGDEQHYYSPTEHECDDLEDYRYYDYTTLPPEARVKRIGLIVAVMKEVILRLCSLTLTLDNYFPYGDRKKLVKMTLSCNDVCSAFANLPEFRDCIKVVFEHERGQGNDKSGGATQKAKLFKGRYIRDDRLVWQCANWLYDWSEAMTTLQEDIKRYGSKIQRKDTTGQPTGSPSADTTASVVDMEDSTNELYGGINNYVADLHSAVEAGLSTITGILSVPTGSDVTGGIVADYLKSLTRPWENPTDAETWDYLATTVSSIDQIATFTSSHNFLRTLLENPSKLGRLPCFSYTHHSELELSALSQKWPSSQSSTNPVVRGLEEEPKLCQHVMDNVRKMVDDVLHGRREVSYNEDDVLKLCNETADGLCLSVLSIMARVVEAIYEKLRPEVERSLNEARESEKMGRDEERKTSESDQSEGGGQQNEDMNQAEGYGKEKTKHCSAVVANCSPVDSSLSNFELLPNAPPTHRFISKGFDASLMPKSFLSAVRREIKMLHSSLPPGIFVKTYEDRMDLFSCMIIGPQGTPYEDGVFFFDVRLKDDYPTRPPHLFYKSMSKLLNPNLYEDGMVCLSLLGTWDGKETELWTPNSTLLQVFVSIQSLILVPEPYFNEPGFEKEKGSQNGATKSRDYNEAAVLRTLESLQRAMADPPAPFREELRQHIVGNSERLLRQLAKYQDPQGDNAELSFPVFPVTQGFCLCIKRHAENLRRLSERWSTGTM